MPSRSSAAVLAIPQECAPLFAALGDEVRLRLVSRLCSEGPMSISRLAVGSNISRQAVTKHLRVMESAGLLQSKRAGRESIFQLEQKRLEEARRYLGVISTHWDDVLTRLRSFVEE